MPDSQHSRSGAALAVWLLTNTSAFWPGPALAPSQVTVVGWSVPSASSRSSVGSLSLAEIRRSSPREAARRALQAIPACAGIVLHFDIDVIQQQDMPAAYFPHPEGLTTCRKRPSCWASC